MEISIIFVIDFPLRKEHGNGIFENMRLVKKNIIFLQSLNLYLAQQKIYIYLIFLQIEFFNIFIFKVLYIVLVDQKYKHDLQEKIPKYE